MPDSENPAYAQIIKGAETAATSADSGLLTASLVIGEESFEHCAKQVGTGRVDGLLFVGGRNRWNPRGATESVGSSVALRKPHRRGKRHYVILDDEHATAVGVTHRLELGHTRLPFVSGPSYSDSAERRRLGYIAAMEAVGHDPGATAHGDYTADGGSVGMQPILRTRKRPTAVLVANVASAVGALYAARRGGVLVPRDMSVITSTTYPSPRS